MAGTRRELAAARAGRHVVPLDERPEQAADEQHPALDEEVLSTLAAAVS